MALKKPRPIGLRRSVGAPMNEDVVDRPEKGNPPQNLSIGIGASPLGTARRSRVHGEGQID